ncbi:MAG: helix-turn-helix transcriptional regulator [Prevotella sp.]|nr:helix-turn-helix transcriptional regulator [Prevotella sp.]
MEQRESSNLLERSSRESRRHNQQNEALNRLRVVLAEQDKTNRWLAEQLGKTEHTISRWCHNKSQPSVAQLNEIANVLNVDVRTLMTPNMTK